MKKIIIAIFFIVLFFPTHSFALLADIGGIASWQTNPANGTIAIHVDQICNNDPGYYSGTIRVGVWAFTQQFYGQTLSGYILGSFTLDSLVYGICWTGIGNTVTYSPPPCGNYYTYVMTETWGGSSWYISDWASTGYKYICVQPTTTTSITTTTTANSTTTSTISVTTTTTVQPTTTTTLGTSTTTRPGTSTTTTPGTSTTTTPGTSTTTSTKQKPKPCPAEEIYGEDSEETELLREYRDNVLSKTPDGQEFIKNYYKFSPTVSKLLESRPLLKDKAKMIIDSMLPGIRKKVEESNKQQ